MKDKRFLTHSLATQNNSIFGRNSQIDKVSNISLHAESFLQSMSSSWRLSQTNFFYRNYKNWFFPSF